MTRKQFSGGAVATKLNGSITAATTNVVALDASSYPFGTIPFVIAIDRGGAAEEKILVTRLSGSNTYTVVTRGFDGTTAVPHADLAVVEHVLDADTITEVNTFVNTPTAIGDILYADTATTVQRLAIGANGQVLTVAAGIPSWATITVSNLASLPDVQITSVVNGQVLTWNSSTSKWVNSTPSAKSPATRLYLFQQYR
jgi:hypothetical protein